MMGFERGLQLREGLVEDGMEVERRKSRLDFI